MDKKEALITLIKHSYLLSDEAKMKILGSLPRLAEEEIESLGFLLAVEKKDSLEKGSEKQREIDALIAKLQINT